MSISSRDFVEKVIHFYENGIYYRYSTTVQDSEISNGEEPPFYPAVDATTVRGSILTNVAMIYRDEKDGKIKIYSVSQCDIKMTVPPFILTTFMPKASKAWIDNISKYYNKNKKTIGLKA